MVSLGSGVKIEAPGFESLCVVEDIVRKRARTRTVALRDGDRVGNQALRRLCTQQQVVDESSTTSASHHQHAVLPHVHSGLPLTHHLRV